MMKAERKQALDEAITELAIVSKWAIEARKDERKLDLDFNGVQELLLHCELASIGLFKASGQAGKTGLL